MKQWKILYFDLVKLIKNDMIWGLLAFNPDVRRAEFHAPDATYTEEDLEKALAEIGDAELVISQNFSAVVAESCHRKQRLYAAWVYDSPQASLFLKEALYETNYVFLFDKIQLNRMKEAGVKNLFYLPLAANVERLSGLIIEDEEIEKYQTDVLFVGSLYQDERRSAYLNQLPEKVRLEVESVLQEQFGKWDGRAKQFRGLTKETRDLMCAALNQNHLEEYSFDPVYLVETLILCRELSSRERIRMLSLLSGDCRVSCYTTGRDNDGTLSRVAIHAPIEGEEEVFKAYYSAKINLNHTLTSIETGIPLRVFDILGVGGFVLCNDQGECHELFQVDKEIVTFSDFDEMLEKAHFYLKHDEQRIRIGIAGYERVRDCYTYPIAMKSMLDTIEKNL